MPKKLVVCFDGTWNNADSEKAETNVALLSRSIRAAHGTEEMPQLVLYLRGVGSVGLAVQKVLEGATGLGLDENIRSAYMFIAQNYVPGDLIYLFGFSRGAFTARSLSGLIGSCGILRRDRLADLGKAWRYYKRGGRRSPADFVARNGNGLAPADYCHIEVEIQFVGVWDTVGALGIPSSVFGDVNDREYGFHDTSPSSITKHAFHAMAIDEFRDEFVPTLWTGQQPVGTQIQQVWFAGAHSDVGGGYVDRALANIPLRWMARKAESCGLIIDWTMLTVHIDPLAPRHDSRSGYSVKDRLTPTFRQVCGAAFEVSFYENLYRPSKNQRPLPTINESIHRSVIERYGNENALLSPKDNAASNERETYLPRNLAPFFENGVLRPGTRIDEDI